ncbi:MAG: signal peptidase II [Anaerolineales bacterium]|nr:signal peptidase II [Anaerolineales bacterium]
MTENRLSLQRLIRHYLDLVLISGSLIALDQWTKALVRAHIPLGGDWLPPGLEWLLPYARIRHWYNTGAAFGLFQDGNLVFTILAFLVSGFILYYYHRLDHHQGWLRLTLALQLAGAIGNLIDRLRFGHVTDFISVGTFPIFNIADASITIGAILLGLVIFWSERQARLSRGGPES